MSMELKNTVSQREKRDIYSAYLSSQEPQCLATIVAVEGSSFRKKGSMLLFNEDGSWVGSLSGGCIERDIFERSREVFQTGHSKVIQISTGSEEDDLMGSSTGCEGTLTIILEMLEPHMSMDRLQLFLGPLSSQASDGMWVNISQDRSRIRRKLGEKDSNADYSLYHPRVQNVTVFGKEGCARALIDLLLAVGIEVTWVDHRLSQSDAKAGLHIIDARAETVDFSRLVKGSYLILSTHNLFSDGHILSHAHKALPTYVGLIGSQGRLQKLSLMTDLSLLKLLSEFKSPAGVNVTEFKEKNHSPEHVAMSIFLEVQKKIYEKELIKQSGVAGVVLAAGQSKRFGTDKQTATLLGKSLLRLQAEKLVKLPLSEKAVLIRADLLEFAEKELSDLHEVKIIAVEKNRGMGETLSLAAQRFCHHSGLLISLVDQPLIPLEHYQNLLIKFSREPERASATDSQVAMAPAVLPSPTLSKLTGLSADQGARDFLQGSNLTYCDQARYDIDSGKDLSFIEKMIKNEVSRPSF